MSYFGKLSADTLLFTSLVKARFNLNIGYRDFGEKSKTIPTVSHGISANDNLRFWCCTAFCLEIGAESNFITFRGFDYWNPVIYPKTLFLL